MQEDKAEVQIMIANISYDKKCTGTDITTSDLPLLSIIANTTYFLGAIDRCHGSPHRYKIIIIIIKSFAHGWRKTMTNDECPKMLYPFLHIILIPLSVHDNSTCSEPSLVLTCI